MLLSSFPNTIPGCNHPPAGVRLATKSSHRLRKKDSIVTRETILAAAKARFAAESYENAGLRRIAADSHIDVALIARYFGSKKGLFTEVIRDLVTPKWLVEGDRATFGQRMARIHVEEGDSGDLLQSVFVMIRAATSPVARPILEAIGYESFTRPFAAWLGGRDAELRAHFISSTLFGTVLSGLAERKSRRSKSFREELILRLGETLQAWVDGRDTTS
jgi:AcrR family transcriptional regulator